MAWTPPPLAGVLYSFSSSIWLKLAPGRQAIPGEFLADDGALSVFKNLHLDSLYFSEYNLQAPSRGGA
jgi:hypothetical protein